MSPRYGTLAYALCHAANYLRMAHGLRQEQRELKNHRIFVHQVDDCVTRPVNRMVRAYATRAIAYALVAQVLIRTGSGKLA